MLETLVKRAVERDDQGSREEPASPEKNTENHCDIHEKH